MIRVFYFLFTCIVFVGCRQRTKIEATNNITKDTLLYLSGKVKSISDYEGVLKKGWEYTYDEQGLLTRKVQYLDGVLSGQDSSFRQNGTIESVGRWLKGKRFGDASWFYENGNIEIYSFYDFQAHCRYKESFLTDGQPLDRSGSIVPQMLWETDADSIYIDSSIVSYVCVANPPSTEEIFHLVLCSPTGNVIEERNVKPKENIIELVRVFQAKGKYIQKVIGNSYNDRGTLLQSDTLDSEFNVKSYE